MNRRFVILAALALCGCATARVEPPPGAGFAELEPVYAVNAGREAVTIRVASNGCTSKADFAFFVERKPTGAAVAFGRRKLDRCQSFAMGSTELSFTWDELGLKPGTAVFLLNPLERWTGPGS
jgi:hypothetical protein